MRSISLFLALAALFAVALAGSDLTGTISGGITIDASAGNVTTHGDTTAVNYRAVTFGAALDFAYYVSIEVHEQSSGNTATETADGIVGIMMAPTSLVPIPPLAMVMYFHAEASATALGGAGGIAAMAGTASGALAGTVYLTVEEVDASGQTVTTIDLSTVACGAVSTSNGDTSGYVHSAVWTGTTPSFTVSFAGIASEISGFLSTGGAAITPKSLEVVIEFDTITYKSPGNHLRLNVLTVAASAETDFSASTSTIVSGSGANQVYVHFAGSAVVDGNTAAVTVSGVDVSGSGAVGDIGNSIVQGLATANASLSVDVRKVSITFPPGATHISYDPAVGFDASIYSGASALVAPVALIFFAAFFLLFL